MIWKIAYKFLKTKPKQTMTFIWSNLYASESMSKISYVEEMLIILYAHDNKYLTRLSMDEWI